MIKKVSEYINESVLLDYYEDMDLIASKIEKMLKNVTILEGNFIFHRVNNVSVFIPNDFKSVLKNESDEKKFKHCCFRLRYNISQVFANFKNLKEFTDHMILIESTIKDSITVIYSEHNTEGISYIVEIDNKLKNTINSIKGIDKYSL